MANVTSSRKFLEVAALNGVQTSLNLLTGLVSARALAPSGRGEFATVAVYATVLGTILTLGVPQAIVAWKPSIRLITPYIWATLAIVPLVAFAAFASLIASGVVRSDSVLALAAGTLMTSGGVYAGIAAALHQRRQSFAWGFRLIRLGPGLIILGYMLMFWAASVEPPELWLLASGLALSIPSLGICVTELRRSFLVEADVPLKQVGRTRQFVRLALGSAATILTAQVFFRLDSLVGASLLSLENVGFYTIALGAQAAILAVASAATLIAHSDLARNHDRKHQKQIIGASIKRTLIVTGALSTIATFSAPWLVPVVYGSNFEASVTPTQILVISAMPVAVDNILLHTWLLLGRTTSLLYTQAAICLLALGVFYYAAGGNSPTALALTALAAMTVSCLAKGVGVFRLLHSPTPTPATLRRPGGS